MAFFRISELPAGAVPVPVTALLEIASAKGGEVSGYESNRVTVSELFTDVSFVGLPIAPTAPPGTNTNQVATTAFVTEAVSTGVANAPYVHLAGDTMSGGLIAPRVDVAGEVTTHFLSIYGAVAAIFLDDRTLGAAQGWTMYAQDNQLRLQADGLAKFSVTDAGDVNAGGNMFMQGNYLRFVNAGGGVNSTGGPFIFANDATTVVKLGNGANGLWVQDYTGATVTAVTPGGTLTVAGSVRVGNSANPTLALMDGTNWSALYAPDNTVSGHACIAISGAPSGSNTVYRNAGHYFQSIDGAVAYATLDSSGTTFYSRVYARFPDGLHIVAPEGGTSRLLTTVINTRLWSTGVLPDGRYAIGDETAGTSRLAIDLAGATTVIGRLIIQKNNTLGESGILIQAQAGVDAFLQTDVAGARSHRMGTRASNGDWHMRDITANIDRMVVDTAGTTTLHGDADIQLMLLSQPAHRAEITLNCNGTQAYGLQSQYPAGGFAVWNYTANNHRMLLAGGNFNAVPGGTWIDFSDERIKRDVAEYRHGLDEIVKLSPQTYKYNGKGGTIDDGQEFVGLIAQDVEGVLPELVREYHYDPTDKPAPLEGYNVERDENDEAMTVKGLDITRLVFALINATKTLAERLSALEE